MSQINCIKTLRNDKGLSVNAIKEIMGITWTTAKKYADGEQLPEIKIRECRGMMHNGIWGEMVSDWLFEDQQLKRKLRRTNKKLYEQLKEHGFPGSYRTICLYIKEWKANKQLHSDSPDTCYERLEHPLGEGQLDFGVMEVVKDGQYVDTHCLVLSMPYSNGAYVVPLPGENRECLFHGLITLCEQLGKVPPIIRIDNMTTAVIKARGQGNETEFAPEFMQFANYYGFKPVACNVRAGYEKGHVENKVGYVRYNFISPSPVMESYEQLTQALKEQMDKDQERLHYKHKIMQKELLEQEKAHMLVLPEVPWPVFSQQKASVNKYGEITLDKTQIHIPKSYALGHVEVILYWDCFSVYTNQGKLLFSDHRPYMNKRRDIEWSEILKTWLTKPRCVLYSRFAPYLPLRIREHLAIDSIPIRKERIMWLLGVIVQYNMQEIDARFYELIEPTTEAHPWDVDWDIYDQLSPKAVFK